MKNYIVDFSSSKLDGADDCQRRLGHEQRSAASSQHGHRRLQNHHLPCEDRKQTDVHLQPPHQPSIPTRKCRTTLPNWRGFKLVFFCLFISATTTSSGHWPRDHSSCASNSPSGSLIKQGEEFLGRQPRQQNTAGIVYWFFFVLENRHNQNGNITSRILVSYSIVILVGAWSVNQFHIDFII